MELISFTIYILIPFFTFLIYHRTKNITNKAPPEASGARPFTGHLHLMDGGSGQLPHINLAALADKHGPIFTIRLGVNRAVVVSNWELARELFTTCDAVVSSRPKMRAAKHLGYDFAMFGFSPYGSYWRDIRKLISVELLSNRRIELQRNVRISETALLVKELYTTWKVKGDASGRVLVDMKERLGELNLNVLLRMVVGKRIHGGDEAAAEEMGRWREVMREFFDLAGLLVPADAFPFLGWLDIGGHEKKMKETAKELEKIVGGWLEDHRRSADSGEYKPLDFMDMMLKVVNGANLEVQYDADTIIKATCQSLIVAGSDTTSVMLVWSLSLLLNNRSVLLKAQEELDEWVGRDRFVDETDLNNLVYLQAVVKEIWRLYPAGPLGSAREFTLDCNVGGYHVPKGTWLIMNLWKLHRDPQVWRDDSLEFRPERFLDEQLNVDVKGQHFELIPFGAGRRSCPGTNFGLQMMHLVLASLLQAFDLSTELDNKIDMTESPGLTNVKVTPLDVLVSPRLSHNLYKGYYMI